MSIIDLDSCCSSGVRQDKGRHPPDGTFHAFWRGDDPLDLSDINMRLKRISVRDWRRAADI